MTALLEFQRTLARAVMQPLSMHDKMKRGAEDGIALVKPNSRLTSFERLEIYSRSYWFRVLEAFGDDFPGVRALLGAKRFDQFRRNYLADCPSESFTMRNLGKRLVAWMEQHPEMAGANYAIALDMARLEWAEIESFDAAEYERLNPTDISAITPDSTLRLQPHLRLIETGHEVDTLLLEIRESAKRNGGVPRTVTQKRIARAKSGALFPDQPATALAAPSVALTTGSSATPVYLAIHRVEMMVHYKRLDAEMFRLVSALAEGRSIAEAVEFGYSKTSLSPEQCRKHIQDSFALFAALGWFCKSCLHGNQESL